MRHHWSFLVAALAALALPASAVAATPVRVAKGPAGSAFYTPPKSRLAGAHGSIVWARAATGKTRLPGLVTSLVLYRSKAASGATIPVAARLTVPGGKPPAGGWPLISWAHGTTGIADACAPSRDTAGALGNIAHEDTLLAGWVARGYAVVQTDYQGLGTPGVHQYLVGVPAARAIVDAARAARALAPAIGTRWVAMGHSQGGGATLWAAALARSYAPELHLVGDVPFAPPSAIHQQVDLARKITSTSPGLAAFGALIFRGIDEASGVGVAALLGPQAAAVYPKTLTQCASRLAQPDEWGGIPLDRLFRANADLGPAEKVLDANDPGRLSIGVPTRVEQGEADTTVLPAFTKQLVDRYAARGLQVTYRTYPGADHSGVLDAALTDAEAFVDGLFGR
jgi:dienelactone hydrolase